MILIYAGDDAEAAAFVVRHGENEYRRIRNAIDLRDKSGKCHIVLVGKWMDKPKTEIDRLKREAKKRLIPIFTEWEYLGKTFS
jgi:hypothetical protein